MTADEFATVPFVMGDGTGPEIWAATRAVLDAAIASAYGDSRRIDWVEALVGSRAIEHHGVALPEASFELLRAHRYTIKGPLETQIGGGARSLNRALREDRDLYACIRPVSWIRGTPTVVRFPERVDMVLFRETTEDVFAGFETAFDTPEAQQLREFCQVQLGWHVPDDSGMGLKHISETASKRIVRAAVRYAIEHDRRSVTLVHKGNVMKYTEGAFRRWGYEVAEEFADSVSTDDAGHREKIRMNDVLADAMMQAVLMRPEDFDVIVTTNLNGDYLSDALAAQIGGIGLAPGVNVNPETGAALYEAAHGCAPRYAGQDKVNPTALIRSGALMLADLGWQEAASRVTEALASTYRSATFTYDVARFADGVTPVGTWEFAEAVLAALATSDR